MGVAVSSSTSFTFLLNGRRTEVRGADPQMTLLDFLRANGLTGAKEGCAEGECGACAVAMVRPLEEGSIFRPVNSCLVPLASAAGQEIYTVESFAQNGELHPAQAAMAAAGGSQCGYCTPGFVVSLFTEFYRPGRSSGCSADALGGNLCRCTGYRPIRDAAESLGPAPEDDFARRLRRPAPELGRVESAGFIRPTELAEAIEILAKDPSARPIAGGTDLMVESNLKGKRFGRLVSLEAIPELRRHNVANGSASFGAGLSLTELGRCWQEGPAAVQEWLTLFASPLIRNRATLGGNLATASPIGDAAPLFLALDGDLALAGPSGNRSLPLHRFFQGYRQTALERGDLIVSVEVSTRLPQALRFYKVAKRRQDDISTVAAAIAVSVDAQGMVEHARIAYGGVAAIPLRAEAAEAELMGRRLDETSVRRAQAAVARTLTPLTDHRGSAAYRLAMAQSLLGKFYAEVSL